MALFADKRIAIVSDTMVQSGGAERVVEALAEAFPDAPVFTILYDPDRGPRAIQNRVVQSWLHQIPGSVKLAKALIPFYPNAVESFDLREFDVIVSSHHTLAKGILRTSEQTHICYCHTPMRSLWERPHPARTGRAASAREAAFAWPAQLGFRHRFAGRPIRRQQRAHGRPDLQALSSRQRRPPSAHRHRTL